MKAARRTATSAASAKKHPQLNAYFAQTAFWEWSLEQFLMKTPNAESLSIRLRNWLYDLRRIIGCPNQCCHKNRKSWAKALLKTYKKDKERAIKKLKQSKQGADPTYNVEAINSSVVINSSHVAIGNTKSAGPPRESSEAPSESSIGSSIATDDMPITEEYEYFSNLFFAVPRESRWILETGRCVEDVLRDYVDLAHPDMLEDNLMTSLIVNLSDLCAIHYFSSIETKEMRDRLPALPDTDAELTAYIEPLVETKTPAELVCIVATRIVGGQSEGWRSWVDGVAFNMCSLLRSRVNLLHMSQSEQWYNMHVWSQVIHAAFFPVESLVVAAGELICRSSSMSLNEDRTVTSGPENRQKLGSKMDAIIRSPHQTDFLEYGAVESGKDFAGTGATKWLTDGLKLRRVLRDMLVHLHGQVDDEAVERVQTVGFLTSGVHVQLIRCWGLRRGGVVLCENVGPVLEYPRSIGRLRRCLPPLLQMVHLAVQIVSETARVVDNSP